MLYTKEIINNKLGDNTPFEDIAKSLEWTITLQDNEVEQAYDGGWYLVGYAPMEPVPTPAEQNKIIRTRRESLYAELTDPLTARKMRKAALNDWSEVDEANYIADLERLTGQIDTDNPYVTEV